MSVRRSQSERMAVDRDSRTVELAISSEAPYERVFGIEVLEHSSESIDLSRLADERHPLLINHDWDRQAGVLTKVWIGEDKRLRGLAKLSRTQIGEDALMDAEDGIRTLTSVGYQIMSVEIEERNAEGETVTRKLDGDAFAHEMRAAYGEHWHRAGAFVARDGDSGEPPIVRVTRWQPFEASIVSIPADPSVGLGRSAGAVTATPQTTPAITSEVRTMSEVVPQPVIDEAAVRASAEKSARETVSQIISIGEQFKAQGGDKIASEAIRSGLSVEAFRAKLMDKLSSQPMPTPALDMERKDVQRYSLMRAVRAMVDRDWSNAGLEKEASEAIAKRAGKGPQHGGFYVPYDIQTRDLSAGSSTQGQKLVATDLLGGSFIDLLRARSVVGGLGATMLTGLVGNVAIPRQSGAGTGYWLTNEATAITESNQTFDQVPLSPKNVGAYTEISRQLMMQSTPSVDALVMSDLAKVVALAIDLAALEGDGSGGAPTGIASTSGIGAVTGTSIAYAGILEFQTDLASANALAGNCAYLTTPAVASLLSQRARFSSTDTPLWQGNVLDGQMCGFRATTTTAVTAASMVFGNFSDVVIGEWGVLELAMNPYANFAAAITGIRAIQTVDVGIRHAASFSRATSIT